VYLDILFETSRFNLSEVKPHFINDCCFGEDVAAWLRERLAEVGIDAIEPGQEDWGWYIEAGHNGQWYFIGVGGYSEEGAAHKNQGEWRIMVEKRRSFLEKLTGKNKMTPDEEILSIIRAIVEREPDFKGVRQEQGA
jgi:hypothetical protein